MEFEFLGQLLGFLGILPDPIESMLPPQDKPVYVTSGNNILVKNGKIEKLRGTDYLNDVSTQLGIADYRNILGIAIYRQYGGDKFLMAITPRGAYYLQDDTTWTPITGSEMTAGLNDSIFTFANADDKFFFTISDEAIVYEWAGDGDIAKTVFTADDVEDLKARFLLEFKTFLILLRTIEDDTEFHQRFWASDAGVVTTFKAKNKLDLEEEGTIQGGKKLGDNIIAYFNNSIYRVNYDEAYGWVHSVVPHRGGLIAPKSLTGTDDIHFFLSQSGLMAMERGDFPRSISDQKFNRLILDELDPVYFYRATQRFYPHLNLLFLSYPKSGSSFNDRQIIYDAAVGELVSEKTLVNENYSAYGVFEKDLSGLSPDERRQYGLSFIPVIGNKDGYIKEQKITKYQDGVSSYESNIVFPPTFLRDPNRNKRILQIDLFIEKLTNLNVDFGIDIANEMNENFNYSFTIAGTGGTGIRRYELKTDKNGQNLDVFGKEFRVKLRDISCPYGWKMHGLLYRGYLSTIK